MSGGGFRFICSCIKEAVESQSGSQQAGRG